MPPTTIVRMRMAQRENLPDVCAIDFEAFSPYGTAELPGIFQARWEIFSHGFVVAEANDQIVGFGTSEKWLGVHEPAMNEDPRLSHNCAGQTLCITAMAVRKEWRGQGIGSAILDALIQIAREEQCRTIVLETTHAQGFYLERGFCITGEREQMNTRLSILTLILED